MNKIYTSYYPKCKELIEAGCCPISIAGKAVDNFQYPQFKKLAPSWSIWKEWHDSNDPYKNYRYQIRFINEILSKLNVHEIVGKLEEIRVAYNESHGVDYKAVALLCYEVPAQFCHRHIVGEWINLNYPDLFAGEFSLRQEAFQESLGISGEIPQYEVNHG